MALTPTFYLTRSAMRHLQEIERYSRQKWGETTASTYIERLYQTFQRIASNPHLGKVRYERSTPFLMHPCGSHFIVYDCLRQDIVILAVLHQRCNIEAILAAFSDRFLAEIAALRAQLLETP